MPRRAHAMRQWGLARADHDFCLAQGCCEWLLWDAVDEEDLPDAVQTFHRAPRRRPA